MGENSKIAWTHHTYNAWWGCVERSPACDHCYAREMANRFSPGLWGKDAPRRFFGDAHWDEPVKWNRRAVKAGERQRVFCGSMCDVMEDRPDLDAPRQRLWDLIRRTENLDWLLLTKIPQHFRRFLPAEWLENPRPNVWLLTTVESGGFLWRVEHLLETPAAVRGISYEPGLGSVEFAKYLVGHEDGNDIPFRPGTSDHYTPALDWIIAGMESGPKARPSGLDWFRKVRDDCKFAGTAFFMKQITKGGRQIPFDDWPEDLKVREFPTATAELRSAPAIEFPVSNFQFQGVG